MGLKATCPNDPKHKKFITVAHVSEEWVVDSAGNFLEVVDGGGETVAHPHPDNLWVCWECSAEAKVERVP